MLHPLVGYALFAISVAWFLLLARSDPGPGCDSTACRSSADRRDADVRAERLLAHALTGHEQRQLRLHGYLEVASPSVQGRIYRVPRVPGRIEVHEAGRMVCLLCVEPVVPLPDADLVLAHKLLIEGDEGEYLRVANRISGYELFWWMGNGHWD